MLPFIEYQSLRSSTYRYSPGSTAVILMASRPPSAPPLPVALVWQMVDIYKQGGRKGNVRLFRLLLDGTCVSNDERQEEGFILLGTVTWWLPEEQGGSRVDIDMLEGRYI